MATAAVLFFALVASNRMFWLAYIVTHRIVQEFVHIYRSIYRPYNGLATLIKENLLSRLFYLIGIMRYYHYILTNHAADAHYRYTHDIRYGTSR